MLGRHGAGFVRHLLECLRKKGTASVRVAEELGLGVRRVQQLYRGYSEACDKGQGQNWTPGRSGGGRRKRVPPEVAELWRKMLKSAPAASYSFAASEGLRRHGFKADRATVRRWARLEGLSHAPAPKHAAASTRRWQCQQIGALWQLDVSPHPWFGADRDNLPLFDILDDCSRVVTGTRLYARENLMAYLDFLRRAFEEYGLPLALYVDYHSFFFSYVPEALTYLGTALRFYDVSFRYAPTPQAKGKIERQHQFWQKRLPSYFAAEAINQIDVANDHIQQLRAHHNEEELHRELQMTPQAAWNQARRQKRTVLRPRPPSPWWPYIWSIRTTTRVAFDGTVPAGSQRLKTSLQIGTRLTRCEHSDGSFTFLANAPSASGRPIVLLRYEHHLPTEPTSNTKV